MKKLISIINNSMEMKDTLISKMKEEKGELPIGAILAAVFTVIIAAFVLFPGLEGLAVDIVDQIGTWWNNVESSVFPETAG